MAVKNGKIISISSVKGGVGKTTMAINLAGIYYTMKIKVLIIDADFYSGEYLLGWILEIIKIFL